jgi:N-acetylmuramoyl-L-alanine amidase
VTTQGRASRIVLHYSATYPDQNIGAAEIDRMHRARGFRGGCGYHYVIRRDGTVEPGRPENVVGAHVRGFNTGSIGICLVGGIDRATGPNHGVDNRTEAQKRAAAALIRDILTRHPGAEVLGHRDLTATQCPAYDARAWWASVADQPLATKPVDVSETPSGEHQTIWAAISALVARIFGGRT